ncbi:hypothetical protein COI95_26060 [Bacillus cereus]|nr:hypothetical protein COI95_26060 [Bacillus cereus]
MHDSPHDRFPRTSIPRGNYINAQMWYSRNANTGGPEHTRITEHMRGAESIFLTCERSFTIRNVWAYFPNGPDSYATSDTQLIAENIDVHNLSQDALDVFDIIKSRFDEINVLVCFVEGNFFMDNNAPSNFIGYTFTLSGDDNYLVLISESADPLHLAHELGHVLNFSNRNGSADDPDPFPGQSEHNVNPDNLMFPAPTDTNITTQQCDQFFESRIIQ